MQKEGCVLELTPQWHQVADMGEEREVFCSNKQQVDYLLGFCHYIFFFKFYSNAVNTQGHRCVKMPISVCLLTGSVMSKTLKAF